MPIISHEKPDPNYYINIVQYDDGNWAADPMPVDDIIMYPPKGGYAGPSIPAANTKGIAIPGLRTITGNAVAKQAQIFINRYAPPDIQRNALHTITTVPSSDPTYAPAKAILDWVNSVNSYRDTEIAHVKTLTFNQIVIYVVPAGAPPWPAPPAGLPPVAAVAIGSAAYTLRFG